MSIDNFITLALAEDIGRGDLFEKVAVAVEYRVSIISNSDGILAGQKYVEYLCRIQNIEINFLKVDGSSIGKGDVLAIATGTSIDILRSERLILNILQHASGIATNVKKYTSITDRYNVKLLDTRKTRPLLREFEKYATSIGGAINHRFGLDDALMIKDTHRNSINNLQTFIEHARGVIPFTAKIELECDNVDDAIEALCLDIDILMCDNMTANDIAGIVSKRNSLHAKILIEASGGIVLDNIENYCKTGVDAISVGSLIHQATWLDFSMKGAS